MSTRIARTRRNNGTRLEDSPGMGREGHGQCTAAELQPCPECGRSLLHSVALARSVVATLTVNNPTHNFWLSLDRSNAEQVRGGHFDHSIAALNADASRAGRQNGACDHAASGVDLRVTTKKSCGVYWALH